MLQLSHLYMNIGKIIALSIQIFVGKVMSLLLICNLHLPLLFFQEQVYFTFMTAVTIHNNFEAQINLVQFSHTVVPDSLQPHGLQHARLPCPSPIPGACSNSFPLSRWCHSTFTSSVVPFSSCLQSFPVSGSFPMSQLFTSGGQSIGVSASASVLPINIQDWFLLGLACLITLQSKGV